MNPFKKLITFIMPDRCPFCGKVIEEGQLSCDSCREDFLTDHTPIISGASGYRCVSSFYHKGYVRRMILRVKYHDRIQYLPQIAVILAQDIKTAFQGEQFDLITAVPMHFREQKKRGYNQSVILSKELSKQLDIPYRETLEKVKDTPAQHSLKLKERKTNLKGAFRCIDPEKLKARNILIVDDIITSGSTLSECCKTLVKAQPGIICCASIAKTDDTGVKEKKADHKAP